MGTTLRHIIIPTKSMEELSKAKNFFINVLGLKLQKEGKGRVANPKMTEVEANKRLPDYYCHIIDEAGLKIDLVAYDNENVSYGKGVVIGFNVDNIRATWNAALKGYPVRPIFEPLSYPESILPILGFKEGYTAFFGLKMARISNDGEEQILMMIEHRDI